MLKHIREDVLVELMAVKGEAVAIAIGVATAHRTINLTAKCEVPTAK